MIPIIGNHDRWVCEDLKRYLSGSGTRLYDYNTVDILLNQLPEEELKELILWIEGMPKYIITECGNRRFMLAHSGSFDNPEDIDENMFTMSEPDFFYLKKGISELITVIGHNPVNYIRFIMGEERENKNTIWVNKKRNVFCIDCGCGFGDKESRLGCLRLNDFEMYYS